MYNVTGTKDSDANDKTFVGKNGVRKDTSCLGKEGGLVFDGSTEMTDAELFSLGIACKSGSLESRCVECLTGSKRPFVEVGCFVIKQCDALK